ncbi:hypothetical protein [Candidatus Nanohalococcus occultus]|uniref:hypothetical protein n=1 Tax=Candidatus Nanohalococcus occultus TaxID=2978047 RepID=UPI0039DFA958
MIKQKLDSITEEQARNANLVFSTTAGLIYFWLAFNMNSLGPMAVLAPLLVAAAFDWSTVYFVHSGVLSGTLTKIMSEENADSFMKMHLWPGMVGYLLLVGFSVSLFFTRIEPLYYGHLAGWTVMYLSGLYPYSKLR